MSTLSAGTSSAADATIPHPPGRLPLLGDIRGISPDQPIQDSMRIGRELGPIYIRKFLHLTIVFVYGTDLVAEIVDETRFSKHVGLGNDQMREIVGDGLSSAYNDEPSWQLAHDILLPAFSQAAMRRYHPMMLDAARDLIGHWDRHLDGRPVQVTDDMTKLTLETIAKTGFGYDFKLFERDTPHPFVTAMVEALGHTQRKSMQIPVIGKLVNRAAIKQHEVNIAYLRGVVDEVIRSRTASGDSRTDDILGMMLNTRHPETGERLSDENIRNQVITFLIAGHETTAGALSFALHYLAAEPGLLARAQAEVDAVWGDQDEPTPAFEQIAKLRFLRRVFDEVLRLWPTAPAFFREARQDTLLGGRYPMKQGDWVFVLLPMLHREPVWGGDVEAFDPDRFLPERIKARPAHVYRPWGTGERACIGRPLATHEALLTLGMLVHRYDLHPQPGYELRVQERPTLMPENLSLTLTRRRRPS